MCRLRDSRAPTVRTEKGPWQFILTFLLAVALGTGAIGRALAAAPESGDISAGGLADSYVDSYLRKIQLQAESELFQQQSLARSGPPRVDSTLSVLSAMDPQSRQLLIGILQDQNLPVVQLLHRAAQANQQRSDELVATWRDVRSAIYQKRIRLFELKAERHFAGQMASLLSVNHRWFWAMGVVAFAGLVLVALHDRRHEIRRWLNGGKARAMGAPRLALAGLILLSVVTVVVFFFGDRVYAFLAAGATGVESPRQLAAAENRALAQRVQELETAHQEAQRHHEATLEAWSKSAQALLPAAEMQAVAPGEDRLELRRIAVALRTQKEVAAQLEADLGQLEGLEREIAGQAEEVARYDRIRRWIRGGLGLALLTVAVGGGLLLQRGIRRRRNRIRNTCPQCLGENTLKRDDREHVRCAHVLSEETGDVCRFRFLAIYREMVKLCFPTLGAPSAGKTHWATEVFAQLTNVDYREKVRFELLDFPQAAAFEKLVERIHVSRLPLEPTQVGIPSPLVFKFRDHDRLGRSSILMNLFDYSGEVVLFHSLDSSAYRRRALDADGFLFFLDPTRASHDQARAMHRFREDLARIRKLKPGRQLHSPVALCVSKIDLMVNQPYAEAGGGGLVGEFYAELARIGWNSDPASIALRSQCVRRLRDVVWPRWNIEREVDDLFGGRYLYFPMTPVGLEEPGEDDLARRTLAPVGILEPLLWLLHMNGYPVWERAASADVSGNVD